MADEKEFVIIVKAKDLVKHTFKMATAKRFPNKYRFTIANRVCDLVLDIFQHVQEVNELDISDPQEFRERQYEQKKGVDGVQNRPVSGGAFPRMQADFRGAMRHMVKLYP